MIDLLEAPGLGLDIDAEGAKKYLQGRGRGLLRLIGYIEPGRTRIVCCNWCSTAIAFRNVRCANP